MCFLNVPIPFCILNVPWVLWWPVVTQPRVRRIKLCTCKAIVWKEKGWGRTLLNYLFLEILLLQNFHGNQQEASI